MGGRSSWRIHYAAQQLKQGGVIAYPTEAVYGLGCDPLQADAVERIFTLKGRPRHKGMILIAAHWEQLLDYIELPEPLQMAAPFASWPGPHTWIFPARSDLPRWLATPDQTLAVRVTAHPIAAALCRHWGGAIVSTSANRSGHPPARSPLELRLAFGNRIDYLLTGPLGGASRPTTIRDVRTGRWLR